MYIYIYMGFPGGSAAKEIACNGSKPRPPTLQADSLPSEPPGNLTVQ